MLVPGTEVEGSSGYPDTGGKLGGGGIALPGGYGIKELGGGGIEEPGGGGIDEPGGGCGGF